MPGHLSAVLPRGGINGSIPEQHLVISAHHRQPEIEITVFLSISSRRNLILIVPVSPIRFDKVVNIIEYIN